MLGLTLLLLAALGSSNSIIVLILLFILNANEFVPSGNGTTIRHKRQTTYIIQNNTPRSNKNTAQTTTQTLKDTLHNEYNANTIRATTNTTTIM
jgi:hypothetical protein